MKRAVVGASLCLVFLARFAAAGDLPNPWLNPGALNPAVTQENIHQTVCIVGYTATIRPPEKYTYLLKKQQIRAYGYLDRRLRQYEEDHIVALSIGGHPTDPRNLWPQPRNTVWNAKKKDALESKLHRMVCRGEITLAEAQRAMATDWIKAYKQYVNENEEYEVVD